MACVMSTNQALSLINCVSTIYFFLFYIYIYTYISASFKSRFISHAWKNRANYSAEYVVHRPFIAPRCNYVDDLVVVVSNLYFTLNTRGGKVYTGIALEPYEN